MPDTNNDTSRAAARRVAALLGAAAALALAGCATPPKPVAKYVAPTSGPTAKLVMRGAVAAGDGYGVYLYDNAETCSGLRSAGIGNSTRNPTSTTLAANRITTVEFFLVKPDKHFCTVQWSFTPLAGKTYLLNGASLPSGCGARVMDMSDPDNMRPEATALHRNPGTSHCLPLAQSRAASTAGTKDGMKAEGAVLRPSANADDLKGLIAP